MSLYSLFTVPSYQLLVRDVSQGLKMRRNESNSVSPRVKLWPWIGSEIRSAAFLTTHKCCSCAPSKLSALTALRLWALTLHHELKVWMFGHLWHTSLPLIKNNSEECGCDISQNLPTLRKVLTGSCWMPPVVDWDKGPTWVAPGAWRRSVLTSLCSASYSRL